jgi:tRNA G18 (ribose-2'-O)-methylase SpoU
VAGSHAEIRDPDDARLLPYRDVGNPAALSRAARFVAEGRLVVGRLIQDERFEIESVLVTPAAHAALGALLDRIAGPVLVAPQAIVNAVTGFNFHRGCLAVARRPVADRPLESMFADRRLLALEGVGNPDNVGGLFRVALALGAGGIVLDAACGDPFYRKAIRTSMGATLRVPFARVGSLPDAARVLKAAGFTVAALTPAADAVDLAGVKPCGRMLLLLGAEGAGLTPASQAIADLRVRIPIQPEADSLNVAVAAGIALHALG